MIATWAPPSTATLWFNTPWVPFGILEEARERECERLLAELRDRMLGAVERASNALAGFGERLAEALRPQLFVTRVAHAAYALEDQRQALGVDGRCYRAEAPHSAPARAPSTRMRLLGGRQSYARVRCDRKRAERRTHGR